MLFILIFCISLPLFGMPSPASLTLEEKVGQLLMVHFHGEAANDDARVLIQEIKVGGFIYYNWSNGLSSPDQVLHLSQGLQDLAAIPLLIAVDQEGGVIARLKEGFTEFPGNRALKEAGEPDLVEAAAFAMGLEMRTVGVNMNLAPVVDVHKAKNPVIGLRSFSDEPQEVLALGKKALQGYKKAHLITTLKHFPGHGDVLADSHDELPTLSKSLEQLEQGDLIPFHAPADVVMTAHLMVPALDPENCSTLSAKTLTYLRKTLGFTGVIITDSLVMKGVISRCDSVDEAAIQALAAGCDLILLGGKLLNEAEEELTLADIRRISSAIVNAVKKGRLPLSRIDEALTRVLKLKETCLPPLKRQSLPRNTGRSPIKSPLSLSRRKKGISNNYPPSMKRR